MATPTISPKHDLGSLRIGEGQRKGSGLGKRAMYAAIPVLIFAGIVAAAYAFRIQKPVVEVAAAAKADAGGRQTLLNASGYVTPRRRATIAAKITGRVTAVFFDEGTHVSEGQLLATLDDSDARKALDSAKADYAASKAAIASLTRSAAREWGRQGITANAIAPGAWTKRGQDYAARDPEGFARAMAARPIGRLGDPESDIAPVAVFLASDDARFVTGHVFYVDGGAHLG